MTECKVYALNETPQAYVLAQLAACYTSLDDGDCFTVSFAELARMGLDSPEFIFPKSMDYLIYVDRNDHSFQMFPVFFGYRFLDDSLVVQVNPRARDYFLHRMVLHEYGETRMHDEYNIKELNPRPNPYVLRDSASVFDAIFRDSSDEDLPRLYFASLMAHTEDEDALTVKKWQASRLREYLEANDLPRKTYWLRKLAQVEAILMAEKTQ